MKIASQRVRLATLSIAAVAAFPSSAQVQLQEMVVTATRFTESASSVPYAVNVITRDEISVSGATSVNEAIMKLLGVPGRLDTSGGGNYTLDLRGFGSTADRNQVVVVDGRRLKNDDLSATNLAVVPIETVERIEVVRGAGTVQYGEGATGGVIVVTTSAGRGVARTNSIQLGATVGSFGLREERASAVLASGGFMVDVAAKDTKSNGHRDNFASTVNNLASSVQWSNDWLRLGALSGRQMVQSGWPGSLTSAQHAQDASQANSLVNFGTSKNENAGVFVQAMLGDWELALDSNVRTNMVRNFSGAAYGADISATNTNIRARQALHFGAAQNELAFGIDTGQWASMSTSSELSDSQTSALYVTDDVTYVPSKTRLSVGLRSENVDKKRSSSAVKPQEKPSSWQLGISQGMGESITAYGRTGTSYRLPTADEFTFVVPGTALRTQTSRDWELGARWVQGGKKVEMRFYRNDLTNELGYDPLANGPYGPGTGANVNFDPTRRQGVELEVKHPISSAIDLRANAAVREAKFTEGAYAGNDVTLVPHQTVAIGAAWQPMGGHSLDASVNWVASQSPTANNQCSMPSYSTVDARYSYAASKFEWAVGVKNLVGAKYYTQAYGCTSGVTTSIFPEAGRSLSASMQVKF